MNYEEAKKMIPSVFEDLRQAIKDELASDREYAGAQIAVMGEVLELLDTDSATLNAKRGIAAGIIALAGEREDFLLVQAMVAGMVLGLGDEDVLGEDPDEMKSRDVSLAHSDKGLVRLGMGNVLYELPWDSAVKLSLEILVHAKLGALHLGIGDLEFAEYQISAAEDAAGRAKDHEEHGE